MRIVSPSPKPVLATVGCHFHLVTPVAPSMALTPPASRPDRVSVVVGGDAVWVHQTTADR